MTEKNGIFLHVWLHLTENNFVFIRFCEYFELF